MQRYNNYHKHDHVSGIFTPDTHIKTIDYINRIKELGHDTYFTTNHGSGGDVFEALTLCKQNNIHCKFGLEGYIVENPLEKDNRNYHIVIIPVDNIARKKINYINSMANINGYYYKPRIFIEDLLKLDPNEIYITTACVAGLLKDECSVNNILSPLLEHFGKHVLLEVQNHDNPTQIEINKRCLMLSQRFGLELIAANDSHYIYPEQSKDRLEFLKGKGINYGDEDSFILDYPDYDTMFKRFQKQGLLADWQIKKAIDNTLIFDKCEDININKEIKMPSIYPDFTPDKKVKELRKHVVKRFENIIKEEHIPKEKLPEYIDGINSELKIIEETKEINTADYFLFNEKLVDLAVNKYDGVLTRTGRGSCGSFYVNKILGMTQLDRFTSKIKLYPERFMSTARLLENRALPDIDYNVVSQEPFVKAAKELLGENGCYPMIAYGTMQLGEAFRNVCRSHGMSFDEFNDVAKNIEEYLDDEKWKPYIEEANKYVDTIVSASVHPCAFVLDNKNLLYEYGVVRLGENICCMITSGEADEYKMLKDDFLIVKVWKLISETFDLIGKPIITVKELLESADDRVWDIYKNGLTCTLNQVDGDWATSLLKQYCPTSDSEMAMFVSSIRPSFNSWRDMFIHRQSYSTGSKALDEVLSSTDHYILFQENLMQYFEWLGVTPAESIGLIKKISKKKIHQEDFDVLEDRLRKAWIENTGSEEMFDESWKMIQSCIAYGFCSAHGLATGIDSMYGAYLKVNYPLEYYTVALTNYSDDMERTHRLTEELKYFNIKLHNIKFGHSKADYSMDKETNSIYKGISSIKYCNSQIAEELYELSKNHYNSFPELLKDINEKTSVNSRQLTILTILDFFSDFGKNKYLLDIIELCSGVKEDKKKGIKAKPALLTAKQIKKDKMEELGISEYLMTKYAGKETSKMYSQIDNVGLVTEMAERIENKSLDVISQIKAEQDFLEYVIYTNPNVSDNYYCVINYKHFKEARKPYVVLHNLNTGEDVKTRIKSVKVYENAPFGLYSILKVQSFTMSPKVKNVNGEWVKTEELEPILTDYEVIKE